MVRLIVFSAVGTCLGLLFGWFTRPELSDSYMSADDPDGAYLAAIIGHLGIFGSVGLVLGAVIAVALGFQMKRQESGGGSMRSPLEWLRERKRRRSSGSR